VKRNWSRTRRNDFLIEKLGLKKRVNFGSQLENLIGLYKEFGSMDFKINNIPL
jgi:hypothetical protein